jgi:hypothetical protein
MRKFKTPLSFKLSLLAIFILLTACGAPSQYHIKSNYSQNDIFQDQVFGEPITIPTLDEIFALTPEQKQDFLNEFHHFKYKGLSDSQRIYEYLRNKLQYFNFHSETLNASDAMTLNAGNCMSLAILTKALSQLTNVGITYELARTPPVFQREANLELSSQHIRTVVFNKNGTNIKQFIKPNQKVKIDYFSTTGSRTLRTVKKDEFYSLFYSNRAAEAMVSGDDNAAYWYIKEALKVKEDNVIAINLLGVIYQRNQQEVFAERTYRYGLSFGHDQLELLNNYHKFLTQANRIDEANTIAQELENYHDPDPFKWLDLADKELAEKNYLQAIKLYEKAAEKADYLHQPYAGIAKANFFLGRTTLAIKAMKLALENSHTQQTSSIYQAKYEIIQKQLKPH